MEALTPELVLSQAMDIARARDNFNNFSQLRRDLKYVSRILRLCDQVKLTMGGTLDQATLAKKMEMDQRLGERYTMGELSKMKRGVHRTFNLVHSTY